MNYLAHIYLSGDDDEDLMIGNYIGDCVKGRRISDYPFRIQCGLLLHREIDSFTDTHPVYLQSKRRFMPVAGHYAGVVCDVVYDHFLAKNRSARCIKELIPAARDLKVRICVENVWQNTKELV